MKTLQIILLTSMLVMLVACNAEQAAPFVDNLNMDIRVEPDPPTVGESTLIISVNDANGNAIDNATVTVHGDMDHEGMTPVDSESKSGQNGVYHVPFEWTMGGGWILNVTVTLPDNAGIATEQFELFVGAISQDSIVNQGDTDTAGIDHNAMEGMKDAASSINIHYIPDNDPALAGDAEVIVVVTTTDGQPIDDATVALYADMPAHDMMSVTGTSEAGIKGRYTIPVRWTMAGEWRVDITVTRSDQPEVTQTYTQPVIMPDESEDEMAEMADPSD